jgi:hypothetical protein
MRKLARGALFAALLVSTAAFGMLFAGQASADSAGTVHFTRSANSSFDQFTSSPTPQAQEWLRTHVWRMNVWSPYFDEKTGWYPNGWVYDDAYAIYTGEGLASQHPEWILKDAAGNKLYIPWGCSGGSCPQYAGDISNSAFRQYWINNLKARMAHGYKGVFIDDVNMNLQVGNGQGESVAPIDGATGGPMTPDAWRHYMAAFMAEVRQALPSAEIVHNVIWFAAGHAGTANPDIKSELSSADFINLERGANDSGLTGGSGPWSLNALLSYVDQVHGLGRNVTLDGNASDPAGLTYNLAAYFLISSGNDAVSGGGQTPANWWAGWSVSLGQAAGARYSWNNLLRRDFSAGMVLLNGPGEPSRTVSLGTSMQDLAGNTVSSVTLGPGSATVLRSGTTTAPSGPPSPTGPQPTRTTVEPTLVGPVTAAGKTPGVPSRSTPRAHRHHRHGSVGTAYSKRSRTRWTLARVAGRVLRATRGRVTILVEIRRGGRWVTLRHISTKLNARGQFQRMVQLRNGAHYRVRALYKGAPGYRPSRSSYRRIAAHGR